jgi:hypothetical protein
MKETVDAAAWFNPWGCAIREILLGVCLEHDEGC